MSTTPRPRALLLQMVTADRAPADDPRRRMREWCAPGAQRAAVGRGSRSAAGAGGALYASGHQVGIEVIPRVPARPQRPLDAPEVAQPPKSESQRPLDGSRAVPTAPRWSAVPVAVESDEASQLPPSPGFAAARTTQVHCYFESLRFAAVTQYYNCPRVPVDATAASIAHRPPARCAYMYTVDNLHCV